MYTHARRHTQTHTRTHTHTRTCMYRNMTYTLYFPTSMSLLCIGGSGNYHMPPHWLIKFCHLSELGWWSGRGGKANRSGGVAEEQGSEGGMTLEERDKEAERRTRWMNIAKKRNAI